MKISRLNALITTALSGVECHRCSLTHVEEIGLQLPLKVCSSISMVVYGLGVACDGEIMG